MAFSNITPTNTPLAQLRAVLRANLETQGGLQTTTQFQAGDAVSTSTSISYANMVDEALAALLGVLIANTSGATQTALSNFRTQIGV